MLQYTRLSMDDNVLTSEDGCILEDFIARIGLGVLIGRQLHHY